MAIGDRRVGSYQQSKYGSKSAAKRRQRGGSALTRRQLDKQEARRANAKRKAAATITDRRIGTQIQGGKVPTKYTAVASVGDSWASLDEKYDLPPGSTAKVNTTQKPPAGASVNIPPKYFDPGYGTAEETEGGMKSPRDWNMPQFTEFIATMGTEDYSIETPAGAWNPAQVNPYWQDPRFAEVWDTPIEDMDEKLNALVTEKNIELSKRKNYSYQMSKFGADYYDPEVQAEKDIGKYGQRGMYEMPGVPLHDRWALDESDQWVDRGKVNYFDSLYEINEIDPRNPGEVQAFWAMVDDSALFTGEFFDVIEWPTGTGGYGGYGGGYEYPQYEYGGGGYRSPSQKPASGERASYFGLTSWSI